MDLKKLAAALRENDWVKDAACRDADPDIFFEHNGHADGAISVTEAKGYCNGNEYVEECPVRVQCLEYAMVANERYGVWGGLDEAERRSLKRDIRYRRKLREETAKRVEEERASGHVIRTERRIIARKYDHG